jgi:hypothetical protein
MSPTPPSTPPPPPTPPVPLTAVTPPTSPQLAQEAACHQEHNLYTIGSPEQRRTPARPSALPPPALPTFHGQTYHHLPADLAAQLAALPPLPSRHLQWPTTHPQTNTMQPNPVSLNHLFNIK